VNEWNDDAMLASMMTGNQEALHHLFDRHAPYVYSLCLKLACNEAHADAMLIEAFCRGRPAAPVYAIFFTMHVYR